ncbi:hypothetical protein Hanom_Chr06g00521021 [Helianthus anomalus]
MHSRTINTMVYVFHTKIFILIVSLVEVVEKLGTSKYNIVIILLKRNFVLMLNLKCCNFKHSRWPDVTLWAFDDAKHWTFVDLEWNGDFMPYERRWYHT